jgi:hypothetical protein
MKLPSWVGKTVASVANACVAIGAASKFVPNLSLLGLPAPTVAVIGNVVLVVGGIGSALTHPSPPLAALVNVIFPGLLPAATDAKS